MSLTQLQLDLHQYLVPTGRNGPRMYPGGAEQKHRAAALVFGNYIGPGPKKPSAFPYISAPPLDAHIAPKRSRPIQRSVVSPLDWPPPFEALGQGLNPCPAVRYTNFD